MKSKGALCYRSKLGRCTRRALPGIKHCARCWLWATRATRKYRDEPAYDPARKVGRKPKYTEGELVELAQQGR